MTTNQMLSFYNVLKKMLTTSNSAITIDHTTLVGNDLMMYNSSTRMNMYTFQYNKSSLKEIVDLMKVNLELKEPELIKSFNFSINEEYQTTIAGQSANVKPEASTELMPNLVGESQTYAQNWANAHNITLSINYISEGVHYNENSEDGTIVTQSVVVKTPLDSVKTLTIGVIKHQETKEDNKASSETSDEKKSEEKNESNNSISSTDSTDDKENEIPDIPGLN